MLSQVSKARPPPHERRPVRGDPGPGAPALVTEAEGEFNVAVPKTCSKPSPIFVAPDSSPAVVRASSPALPFGMP